MADQAGTLSFRERLAARQAARKQAAEDATANGADNRTPRTLEDNIPPPADPPAQLRRRRFAEPAPKPEDVVEEPAKPEEPAEQEVAAPPLPPPTQRRRVINADGEEVQPPATTAQPIEKIAEAVGVKLPDAPTRTERVTEQARQVSNEIVVSLLEAMRAGEQLLITREDGNVWKIVMPTSAVGSYQVRVNPAGVPKVEVERKVPENPGKLPTGFEQSMMNPDYIAWQDAWRKASVQDKIAQAKELGVVIPDEATTDPLIFNMKLSMGVQQAKNLAKWKPQYATVESRKLAKEKAMRGLEW